MTKTFDELDARVTLLGEEVARLGHRDGTVRGQIEDLQGRVKENDTLHLDVDARVKVLEKITKEHLEWHWRSPHHGEDHIRIDALEAKVEDLENALGKAMDATTPAPPPPAKFERPCWWLFRNEFGIQEPGDHCEYYNDGPACAIGKTWEKCPHGGQHPHLAEYREPAPKPERAKEYPKCPRCGRAVVGAMMTGRAIERDGQLYYHPDDISVYCESGACNYDQKLSSLPTPSRIPFENTAPKPACESRGFVDTVRVIRTMGDKVKP